MAKNTTSFVCQECGYDSPKFLGKCPECGEWNSLKEIRVSTNFLESTAPLQPSKSPQTISEIKYEEKSRISTQFNEFDTVLGGGIVKGSVILLAGDPGVGKSTLLLQAGLNISQKGIKVLYISGEESETQIKIRAARISKNSKSDLLITSITNSDQIVSEVSNLRPDLVFIDSIQMLESENLSGLSGSIGQVRYACSQFIKVAKTLNIPMILVGHVTKEGMVAGPMILSHMVDTVLFLEGDKNTGVRILRSLKNRFGPIDEVGIFAMEEAGMKEVKNPEELFLTNTKGPGSVLVSTMEGTRAFLVEVQALAVYSKLPMPRRVAAGVDYKRLELLLAVLQKHCRLPVEQMDVYLNVAGGLKLSDPACDLGICLAIFSSVKNLTLNRTVGIAEVGLLGELRTPAFLDKRIKQAKKLGFSKIITPKTFDSLNKVLQSMYGKEN
jgi:DNA repair protein RadA/Sms